ncbi:MAG: pimeloyl-ACP methyl ester esterase BioH [Gallionella sp.]|nr:pimeloyl-ACP methyl ester esterase BioH [Gallionella sp.]
MNLHVETSGEGAPLLLIHGWGMHGGMWGGVTEQLAQHFQVLAVDLPGHGHSAGSGKWPVVSAEPHTHHSPLTTRYLDSIVDQLAEQFSDIGPLTVCGWSLGGQVALRWALRYPQQVNRLVLVSSTPCFVQQTDWPCAMAADTLAAFSASLQQDYLPTLRRFLALQVRGSEQERELLVTLRHSLLSRGEPDLAALQSGLEILRDCDLRVVLPEVVQPALVIAGERDTLTPLPASHYLAAQMPNARLATIRGAAHAPFLSHPDIFVKQLVGFLHG